MSFTDIFIKRPVFATVLSLIILLTGLISYFKLPLRQYPKIDATEISISTAYPGASPSLMETQVTTPIENAIAGVEGIDYISSSNTEGESDIHAHFKLGYNINAAVADVVNKVSSVRWQLPKDVNDPVIRKDDPNAMPILFIAFSDPNISAVAINDYLVRSVQPVLGTLSGVGEAKVFGQLSYAMRIWLNPYLMASRGVTALDIESALSNNNLQSPTGRIENTTQEFNTVLDSNLINADQFNNLVIREDQNSLIRIKDIGYAKLGTPERRVIGLLDGKQTNVMGIITRSDANPLSVANKIKQELKTIAKQFPKGLRAQVVWDNAKFISASIKEVKKTIIEAVVFVILIIFLFLGSFRTIAIPAVTIPLSLIGVCSLMFAMNYSLNTMTFLAFVLAIGMVVDDAIVVSENIQRNIELGKNPVQAALTGAREIRFAIIAMTLTLAAVYAPIVFMTGLTGALFKEFAFTLAAAVIISGFIALTLSPMMCSKIFSDKSKKSRLENAITGVTHKLTCVYRKSLTGMLRFRSVVAVGIVIIIIGCVFLYRSIPEELAPKEDLGGIMTFVTAPATANLQYTEKYTRMINNIYKKLPSAELRLSILGVPNGVNSAWMFLTLKNWSQRKRTVDQIIASLYPKLMAIPGVMAFPVNPFSLPGSSSFMPINFVIKSTGSYQELNKVAQKVKQAVAANPMFQNVDIDMKIDKPEIDINVNRNMAADLGVPLSAIGRTVNLALGEPQFNRFDMDGRSYYVLPQLTKDYRDTPATLDNLYVRTKSSQLVPISSFIELQEKVMPQSLNHFQQMRSATITGVPAPGYTLGQALSAIEGIAKKYMKSDMQYDFSGQSRQFMEANGTMMLTFIFAIVFIFLVLSAQFESFRDPLIVMCTVLLSTAGALLLIKLSGSTMNIYTQIGLVTLIGLISKHGILMVEFANQLQGKGKSIREAIIEAASIRLRPILMTTFAMILSAVPLALASGAGANSRHQIGLTIIGGMSFGTLFTLFVVPTVYTWLASKKHRQPLQD